MRVLSFRSARRVRDVHRAIMFFVVLHHHKYDGIMEA